MGPRPVFSMWRYPDLHWGREHGDEPSRHHACSTCTCSSFSVVTDPPIPDSYKSEFSHYTYIHTYTHMRAHTPRLGLLHVSISAYAHHTHTHAHAHTRSHARTHARTHVCLHAHARTHTRTHTHTHCILTQQDGITLE